jgi:hypothetical protein
MRACATLKATAGRERRLIRALGKARWDDIKYTSDSTTPITFLWAHREPLTLAGFHRAVATSAGGAGGGGKVVGILREFMAVEPELAAIKHLPSVLAWHRVLFEAFRDGLSREQAAGMVNSDVIKLLAPNRQKRARGVLARFCVGFNSVFPKIRLLFGCQENHFSDLVMGDDTPIVHGARVFNHGFCRVRVRI